MSPIKNCKEFNKKRKNTTIILLRRGLGNIHFIVFLVTLVVVVCNFGQKPFLWRN